MIVGIENCNGNTNVRFHHKKQYRSSKDKPMNGCFLLDRYLWQSKSIRLGLKQHY